MHHDSAKDRLGPSGFLRFFDRTVGVFVQLFDPRLLTLAVALLMGYCTLFTQRKFPDRWRMYLFYEMLILMVVTLTARTPGLRGRLHWRIELPVLWFGYTLMMLVSGFFNREWLPEAVSLLVAYPFVFAVFSAREDHDTFQAIARGTVLAVLPFLLWSYLAVPIVWGYPGYYGVFYNANGLAMCAIALAVAALLLAQARWFEGRRKGALGYALVFLLAALTLLLTWARSAWVAFLGVLFVMGLLYAFYQAKHRLRILVGMLAALVAAGGALGYVTYQKTVEVWQQDYQDAIHAQQYYDFDLSDFDPATRRLTLDDFASDRLSLWREALTHLTWNGHDTAVIETWAAIDGGDRRLNAHNSFVAVAYNHGWPAGLFFLAYVTVSLWRSVRYYRARRRVDTLAITPLAITICFVMESLFESVYSPVSVIGCLYLLVQGVLWPRDPQPEETP